MGDDDSKDRILVLERDFRHLLEAIERMEKNIQILGNSIQQVYEKLDDRYPTREIVDERLKNLERRLDTLEKAQETNVGDHENFKRTIYKAAGAVGAAAFVVGVAVTLLGHWMTF
jgi:septation ring formation regulator EzrA